jgi:periplasmic protein TonB
MITNNNIFSNEWCDLIFEGKNKEYGAYEHRIKSYRRHFWALILGAFLFVFVTTIPAIMHIIMPKQREMMVSVRTLSDLTIDKPKEPQENILKEIPPPPPIRNTIKFTPPVIKPDDAVNDQEEPKMQKEIVEQKAAIGTVDFSKGTDDVAAPIAKQAEKITEDSDKPFLVAEKMPQFPGGEIEMMKFINENLKYPARAQEAGVMGKVVVNFVVGRDGKITNIKIVRGIGSGCDEEAVRVLEKMPPWTPGEMGGKAVPVYFTFPITFRLN